MEPNATLRHIRGTLVGLREFDEVCQIEEYTDTEELWHIANQLADYVEALDGWLTRGGCLPQPWADNL